MRTKRKGGSGKTSKETRQKEPKRSKLPPFRIEIDARIIKDGETIASTRILQLDNKNTGIPRREYFNHFVEEAYNAAEECFANAGIELADWNDDDISF